MKMACSVDASKRDHARIPQGVGVGAHAILWARHEGHRSSPPSLGQKSVSMAKPCSAGIVASKRLLFRS